MKPHFLFKFQFYSRFRDEITTALLDHFETIECYDGLNLIHFRQKTRKSVGSQTQITTKVLHYRLSLKGEAYNNWEGYNDRQGSGTPTHRQNIDTQHIIHKQVFLLPRIYWVPATAAFPNRLIHNNLLITPLYHPHSDPPRDVKIGRLSAHMGASCHRMEEPQHWSQSQ